MSLVTSLLTASIRRRAVWIVYTAKGHEAGRFAYADKAKAEALVAKLSEKLPKQADHPFLNMAKVSW